MLVWLIQFQIVWQPVSNVAFLSSINCNYHATLSFTRSAVSNFGVLGILRKKSDVTGTGAEMLSPKYAFVGIRESVLWNQDYVYRVLVSKRQQYYQ